MGRIIHFQETEKGPRNYFCGNISKIQGPDSDDKPFNITLRVTVWNNTTKKSEIKTLRLAGWNNDTVKHADNMRKMKLRVGAYVCGICGALDTYTTPKNYTMLQSNILTIRYGGEFATNDDQGRLMLSGRIGKLSDKGGFSFAVDAYDKDAHERVTKWYNINCAAKVQEQMNAAGILKPGTQLCMMVRPVNTAKPTKNPVMECTQFDYSDPESATPQRK